MIRTATLSDIDRLLELAAVEHGRSRFKDRPLDPKVALRSFEWHMSSLLSRVLISPGGFIAGMVQPGMFNRSFTAYELCWFAQDGSGMALLREFAKWAKNMRAIELVVSNYSGMNDTAQFNRVMQRAGFSVLGATYTKSLQE